VHFVQPKEVATAEGMEVGYRTGTDAKLCNKTVIEVSSLEITDQYLFWVLT
jgi:hypothetical protein